MRRNSTSSIGAFHPILFFLFVYGISLFLAIFVCRMIYFSLNENSSAGVMIENLQDMSRENAAVTAYK